MKIILIAVVIAMVAACVVASGLLNLKPANIAGKYKRGKFMTDNEWEFFGRLVKAFPEHYVFPQVGMLALLEASSSDAKRSHSDRLRIAQQRVDYVIADQACAIIAVVELDDNTHSKAKDQIRDARLAQGGFRTVRFESRNKPSIEAVRAAVLSDRPTIPSDFPTRSKISNIMA